MHLAYRVTFSEGIKVKHCSKYRSKYQSRKDNYESQMKNCPGIPGIIYNFNTQNF